MKSILNYLLFFFLTGQCVTDFPFRNVSLPIEERLDDLLGRLTVAEILDQMSHGGGGGDGSPVPAIPELGIGTYSWGTECIHGDQSGNATSFPLSIGLAATFNPELMKEVASAISTEVRAKNNDFVRRGIFSGHTGLNCFSPVINIMRHPLWGRNQETYGEDPFLTGVLAAEFVKGLIGNHSRYYRANAVCKHFDAYGGPEDLPQSRLSFNAKVPEQDLYMTYLPQFKHCVQSGALGVMCSYNSVNGIPACANKMLLTDVLRKKWNFPGFVISDSGAVEFLIVNHRYIENIEDAAVACVKAGLNLELHPGSYARGAFDWLKYAIADGKLSKIVGPFADNPVQQMGDYGPDVDLKYTSTVSSGLLGLGDKLVNVSGCKDTWCVDYDSKAVITAVQDADLVVLCLGTGPAVERENFDRRNMLLPGHQPQLMKDVMLYARGRIILLLFSAGPLDIRAAQQPVISAIIQCFFPAQATGVALYHVLTFSQPEANPAGRLPFTWYTSDHQVPSMTDYSMTNRTYRYFNDDPLYPFGYGLSYTQFMYSDLELSPTKVKAGENVTVRFVLTNVGDEAGEEVTQVYISWLNATVVTPRYQLVHFNRTMFYKGWTVNARIDILSEQMAVYVPEKGFVIEPGDIRVYVGGQLPNQKTKVPSNVIQGIFTIV